MGIARRTMKFEDLTSDTDISADSLGKHGEFWIDVIQ